jgi:hypothetical protein
MEIIQFDLNQALSMAGAALVLSAFLGLSFKKIHPQGLNYAALNFVGTGLLAISVWKPLNLGIFLVEVIWSAASFWLCVKALRNKTSEPH